jgi:hypothetical protein
MGVSLVVVSLQRVSEEEFLWMCTQRREEM